MRDLNKINPVVMAVFVLSVVSMNLLANKELFRAEWIALDCGILLSWIPFLIMDAICKAHGGKTATSVSIFAIVVNLALFGIFKLVSLTPGMWGAYYDTGDQLVNQALNDTIGGSWWIVLGSAFAMAVSSLTNSGVNMALAKVFRKEGYRHFAIRSFVSTAVAQFTDNLVFALVVSVFLFGWSATQVLVCSASAAALELLLEAAFSGIGYRLSKKMEAEKE